MNPVDLKINPRRRSLNGFTLVEMLVVIAIMSILMTAGAIGLGGVGGKGVTSGVATAESLFDEARSIAVGQRTKARVLIAKELDNAKADNLRRIVVVSEALNSDGTPNTGTWILSSRGLLLPDQVYFSQNFSKKDQAGAGGTVEVMTSLPGAKAAYAGSYYYYEFNSEGICKTPGASFVIGAGVRSASTPTVKPKVTSSGKRDFGGFVIWRNGRTSVFRSPDQISSSIKTINSGTEF